MFPNNLWGLCILQMVRRHCLERPRGIVDHQVTKSVKVWKSPEDLPRVIGRGLCDFSLRRIWWGLYVWDCVSSGLNTQPLQPYVQLSQQLELVYQIIVFTKPSVLFPQLFNFLIHVLMNLIITVWRLSLKTFSISSTLFLQSLCLQPAYPVFTLPVLCACFHFIMMTMWWPTSIDDLS